MYNYDFYIIRANHQNMISSLTGINTTEFQKILEENSKLLEKPDLNTEDIELIYDV